MNNNHQKYNAAFLNDAHLASSMHRTEIEANTLCGCFYCLSTFSPDEIVDWVVEPSGGETALCPQCGIDAVLSSKYPITDVLFLQQMNQYWF